MAPKPSCCSQSVKLLFYGILLTVVAHCSKYPRKYLTPCVAVSPQGKAMTIMHSHRATPLTGSSSCSSSRFVSHRQGYSSRGCLQACLDQSPAHLQQQLTAGAGWMILSTNRLSKCQVDSCVSCQHCGSRVLCLMMKDGSRLLGCKAFCQQTAWLVSITYTGSPDMDTI